MIGNFVKKKKLIGKIETTYSVKERQHNMILVNKYVNNSLKAGSI